MRHTQAPWLESRYYLFVEAMLVFAAHCALFWWMFGLDSLPIGGDGYFHFTIASQLSFSNPYQSIEALPFTLLGEHGPDHHWLIHWLQKPLTILFPDTESGFAIATIVWAALVPSLLCAILRGYNIPFAPLIAAIGVWGLYLLPDRLLMFRAQNAAIIMVIVLTLLMSAQRYIWVGIFIFFFNHAYQGVVLAGAVGFSALLAHALVYRKFDRLLISASLAGLVLSLLSSPWFPDNIRFFLVVMMGRILSPLENVSLMGTEWLPLGPLTLLKLGLVGHLCLLLSWVILTLNWRKHKDKVVQKRALMFTILASIFLVLYARHWRMGEFYGPVSAISVGFCLALIAKQRHLLIATIVLAVSLIGGIHSYVKKPDVQARTDRYHTQCQYLNTHGKPGTLIFNLSWTAFPFFYHCAPHLHYIAGLDGMLLSQGNTEIFRVWYYLFRGETEQLDSAAVTAVLTETDSAFILLESDSDKTVNWLLDHVAQSKLVLATGDGYLISLERENISEPDQLLKETQLESPF